LEAINDFNITVANDKSPTYQEKDNNNYSEILDLFLVSDKIGRYVCDFKVDHDSDMGNDRYHYPITLNLNIHTVIYEKIYNKKLNFCLAKWNDFKSFLENASQKYNNTNIENNT
jgi:hypothetical protein